MDTAQNLVRRRLLATALLMGLGLLGNILSLHLVFTVDVVFGSIAAMLGLRLLGVVPGVSIAFVASLWTIRLWNHPYAVIIFTAEAAVVGWLARSRRWNLAICDLVYWLTVGMGLVWLLYHGVMGMDTRDTLLIMLQHSVNGITNALIAGVMIILWIHLHAAGQSQPHPTASIMDVQFSSMLVLMFAPALIMTIHAGWHQLETEQKRFLNDLENRRLEIGHDLTEWMNERIRDVSALAIEGAAAGLTPGDELQEVVRRHCAAHPEFHNMYLADADAVTLAFHPPVNQRGESTVGLCFGDRTYYRELQRTQRPYVSDVFLGRGGVFVPILTVSVPVLKDGAFQGFALGALQLDTIAERVRTILDACCVVTLVDGAGNVLASSEEGVRPGHPLPEPTGYAARWVGDHLQYWTPDNDALPAMVRAKSALYVTRSALPGGLPWTILIKRPAQPLLDQVYAIAAAWLAILLGGTILAIAVSTWLSRALSRTVVGLADATADLPARLRDGRTPDWPSSGLVEIQRLIDNFRSMSASLRQSFDDVRRHSVDLGQINQQLAEEVAGHRRTEAALRAGERTFRVLLDAAPYGILLADADGRILLANPAAVRAFACSPDDLRNAPLDRLFGPELPAAGESRRTRGLRHNGTSFAAEVQITEIRIDDEPRTMCTVLDRTEQDALEEGAKRQQHLASVGQLAAGIAHDFNNVLTVILGFADFLKTENDLPEHCVEALTTIAEEGERAAHLVRQLLDFSRQSVIAHEPVAVGPIVQDLFMMIRRVVPESVRIDLDLQAPDAHVLGSSTQLRQLLTNLCLNARDAMPEGGRLTLSLQRRAAGADNGALLGRSKPGPWVLLEVADTGVGMPAEVAEHAFEPFFSTKGGHKGSGLGLAQVYGIVKQHDGQVELETEAGRGCRVRIWLPECIGAAMPPASPKPAAEAVPERTGTALIVEDEPAVRRVVAELVRRTGLDVRVAENGREALEEIRRRPRSIDVVLSDVVMPEMGGVELCATLRAELPHMPVILMSGYPIGQVPQGIRDAEPDAFLSKPLDVRSLSSVLHQLLDDARFATRAN